MKQANNKLIKPRISSYKECDIKAFRILAFITLTILASCFTCSSFAQSAEDTTDGKFHDGLLNHFVGKWDATATVHKEKFTLRFEVEWVFGHQYLRVHLKSNENVPWLKMPYEEESFWGYSKAYKRYFVHDINVHGGNGPYEGFCYAYKTGNEFKLVQISGDSLKSVVKRFIWDPISKSWSIVSRPLADGKEGEPFVEMKLVAAKP